MARSYQPCRECGADHHNPRSSSICPDCGEAASQARQEQEELEPSLYELLDQCQTVDDLKEFILTHLLN